MPLRHIASIRPRPLKVIEEGDGSYPTEEEEEEEDVRVPTDITAEGVELIASYWYVYASHPDMGANYTQQSRW